MNIYHLSLRLLNNIAKMTMCQAYKHASNLSKVSTSSFAKMIPKTLRARRQTKEFGAWRQTFMPP